MKWRLVLAAAAATPTPLLGAYLYSGSNRRWEPEVVTENVSRLVIDAGGIRTVELQREVVADPWWYMTIDIYVLLFVVAMVAAMLILGGRP